MVEHDEAMHHDVVEQSGWGARMAVSYDLNDGDDGDDVEDLLHHSSFPVV